MTPTPNADPNPETQVAPPDTLLGQLQRGTGAGYLRALRTPTAELWPLLEQCLFNDPRWDAQWERRASYYADLMRTTGMASEVLCRQLLALDEEEREDDAYWLPLGTLHACALQQEPQALQFLQEYSRSGHVWLKAVDCLLEMEDPAAWEGLDEVLLTRLTDEELREEAWRFDLDLPAWQEWRERHPRIASAMAAEETRITELRKGRGDTDAFAGHPLEPLVEAAFGHNTWLTARIVRANVQPSDLPALLRNLLPEEPDRCAVAIAGLTALGTPEAFQAVTQLVDALPEGGQRTWVALRRWYDTFPAEWVLPPARRWARCSHLQTSSLGESVVSEHAEAEDLPRLLEGVPPAVTDNDQYRLCRLSEGLGKAGCPEALPTLQWIYLEAPYSWTRRYAAEAIQKLDPEAFSRQEAVECLWDCEEDIRLHAIRHVALHQPSVKARLQEMAADPTEDADVREAATKRLAASLTPSLTAPSEPEAADAGNG